MDWFVVWMNYLWGNLYFLSDFVFEIFEFVLNWKVGFVFVIFCW